MSPNIALFACIVFVTIVFIIDLRIHKRYSLKLIVPFIWLLYSSTGRSLAYWLNPAQTIATDFDISAGSPIDRNFLILLMFLSIIILIKNNINIQEIIRKNLALILLFLYMLISIIWSDYKDISIKRWIRIVGDIIVSMVVLTDDDPMEALCAIFRWSAYIVFPFSIICIKYFRYIGVAFTQDGLTQMWVGITIHKNSLGVVTAIFLTNFVFSMITEKNKKAKRLYIVFILLGLYLLGGSSDSRSNTSVLIFIISLVLMFVLFRSKKDINRIMRISITAFILFYLEETITGAFFDKTLLEVIVESSGRDMTFSGRIGIWTLLIQISLRHWLFGPGFGAFWYINLTNPLFNVYSFVLNSSHNGYINIYLELGLAGFVIFILVLLQSYKNIIVLSKKDKYNLIYSRLRLILLIMILIHNMSESTFIVPTSFLWGIFLLTVVTVNRDSTKTIESP
ncbi:MAG: O-antigen ligase family protein [Spirochaetales bacterium]|nr:O-antigen ligase family protein [Spirochaetales bacterium]